MFVMNVIGSNNPFREEADLNHCDHRSPKNNGNEFQPKNKLYLSTGLARFTAVSSYEDGKKLRNNIIIRLLHKHINVYGVKS